MNEKFVPRTSMVNAPCQRACPVGIDVPRYIRRLKDGDFDQALAVIREKIPFPSICGYACYAPCEIKCSNQHFGGPLAIRALKRVAAEEGSELWYKSLTLAPNTNKRVAVIGAGPGGLTAAYYLAVSGHKVTVLEALEQTGGMLRVGIPAYRLPRATLNDEIDYLKEVGVEIKTGHRVESLDQLQKEGFDAVFIACGAHQGAKLGVPGDDLPGVVDGISFLRNVNLDNSVKIEKRVAVIGGGNTAVDAARSAIRLGAKEVAVFYRRTESEMTAYEEEVSAAGLEGITFQYLAAPTAVASKNGSLEMTLTCMKLGEKDASGRPSPIPVNDGEYKKEYDNLIAAIGQVPVGTDSLGVTLDRGGFIKTDTATLATDKPGIFAGGDVVTGPASIIDAIAHGRKATASIDRYLGGSGQIDQALATPEQEVKVVEYPAGKRTRVIIPSIPLDERTCSFAAVEGILTKDLAIMEAGRCRDCDARQFEITLHGEGCKECSYCVEVCKLDVFGPAEKFNEKGYRPMEVKHPENCIGCMDCYYVCPDFSIDVHEKKGSVA